MFLNPGCKFEDFAQPPRYPQPSLDEAKRIRECLPDGARILIVHCETQPEKRWPLERFACAIDAFLDRHLEYLVFNVSHKEQALPGLQHEDRLVPFFGHPLERALALVHGADLFLGIDSSLLHAADFARVPGVGLFGPTNPSEFGFRVGPHRHVSGSGTLQDVSPRAVVQALEEIVSQGFLFGSALRPTPRQARA
jgi:ADP-heptose:LPS heptosyltransferase